MVDILVGRLNCILFLVDFNVVGRRRSVWFVGLQKFLQKNLFGNDFYVNFVFEYGWVGR